MWGHLVRIVDWVCDNWRKKARASGNTASCARCSSFPSSCAGRRSSAASASRARAPSPPRSRNGCGCATSFTATFSRAPRQFPQRRRGDRRRRRLTHQDFLIAHRIDRTFPARAAFELRPRAKGSPGWPSRTAFAINALFNFLVGLLVAKFLGPAEFGRFALAMATAVLVNSGCFDWIRLSAVRFYSARTRAEAPAVRATLDVCLIRS